jgi:hypothetical protein
VMAWGFCDDMGSVFRCGAECQMLGTCVFAFDE